MRRKRWLERKRMLRKKKFSRKPNLTTLSLQTDERVDRRCYESKSVSQRAGRY